MYTFSAPKYIGILCILGACSCILHNSSLLPKGVLTSRWLGDNMQMPLLCESRGRMARLSLLTMHDVEAKAARRPQLCWSRRAVNCHLSRDLTIPNPRKKITWLLGSQRASRRSSSHLARGWARQPYYSRLGLNKVHFKGA